MTRSEEPLGFAVAARHPESMKKRFGSCSFRAWDMGSEGEFEGRAPRLEALELLWALCGGHMLLNGCGNRNLSDCRGLAQ